MAPGVQVARINSNQWAIGIRGFTSRLSRSILVLIDGRSVYSPLFAGVYWEVQDLLLEDIERIEVIRGPGGTVWGANAVNGVINIITKHAKETHGGLVTAGAGTEERGFGGVRYGGVAGEKLHYRIYAKYFDRDAGFHPGGNDFDDWRMGQMGFRTDLDLTSRDALTFEGDYYAGKAGQRTLIDLYVPPFREFAERDANLSGGNLLFHWRRSQNPRSSWALKTYYDYTSREEANFEEARHTLDVDFQHRLLLFVSQELTWGLGYRLTSDNTSGVSTVMFDPTHRTDPLYTAFLQYRMAFSEERWVATAGSKFEHNDYSGFEWQPSLRLLLKVTPHQTAWTAVTRAVRTPTQLEQDLILTGQLPAAPTFGRLTPNDAFESEEVIAYEVGYRIQPTTRVILSTTAFYNRYSNLSSLELGPAPFTESSPGEPDRLIIPFFFGNRMEGKTTGLELAADWQVREGWRLDLIYSFLYINLTPRGDSTDTTTAPSVEGSSPHHQAGLRSQASLPGNMEFDWFFRYVDRLPAQGVRRYFDLDLRLGWHPTKSVELSLVGQNLLDNHHPEFGGGSVGPVEVQRAVYGKATVRWQ